MTGYFTVYEVRAGYLSEHFTSESVAEVAAQQYRDATVITHAMPLPDITIAVRGGMVRAVTTTDGISVPALVVDYDTDGIDPDRISPDDQGTDTLQYDVD